jgi:squalene synthase HpnC
VSSSLSAELDRVAALSAAQMSAENFPVALRIVPRRPRAALARVYGFARFVDDVGDEASGDRLALLDLVEADLHRLDSGTAQLTPVAQLGPVVAEFGVQLQPLLDLVEANRRDQLVTRYATFAELLDYCRYSAAPVGRVVLALAGVDDSASIELSDTICNALQVLEHCQDVGEDMRAGRIYLPGDDLAAERVEESELRARLTSPRLRRVVAVQVERAARMLAEGAPLVRRLRGWPRFAVSGYLAGGRATVAALRAADCEVLSRDVRPTKLRTVAYATRLVTGW